MRCRACKDNKATCRIEGIPLCDSCLDCGSSILPNTDHTSLNDRRRAIRHHSITEPDDQGWDDCIRAYEDDY